MILFLQNNLEEYNYISKGTISERKSLKQFERKSEIKF